MAAIENISSLLNYFARVPRRERTWNTNVENKQKICIYIKSNLIKIIFADCVKIILK